MSEIRDEPFLGPAEQALFAIENRREYVDQMKNVVVPKLEALLTRARAEIHEVYGLGLREHQPAISPEHRKTVKKSHNFDFTYVGLRPRGLSFLHLQFGLTSSSLGAQISAFFPDTAEALRTVLKTHETAAVEHIEGIGASLWWSGAKANEDDIRSVIQTWSVEPSKGRFQIGLSGEETPLPIIDQDAAWPTIFDYVALFPIYQSAADLLLGRADRLLELLKRFRAWNNRLRPEHAPETMPGDDTSEVDVYQELDDSEELESAIEGGITLAIRRHRRRERRLQEAKICQALREGHGRLVCEVPGCGFDFFEVYGEIGREFAIVHHKNPLSDRTEPELTKLSDLAIVCANCHAMIHRGNDCRPLEGLIKG